MRRSSLIAWALLGATLVLPTVVAYEFFPDAHSQVQRDWQALFTKITWAALVVFVLVEGLLLYAIFRFRGRKDGPQEGPHIHGNTKMEIAWTIAPTLVMAWLLVVSLEGLEKVDNPPAPDFEIDVVAHQFYWEFIYPDANSTLGELHVEAGHRVGLRVTSVDVIHAFNVPTLGVMIDAIPGRINHAWFLPDGPGEYFAQCRELCGAGHGKMHAKVIVFEEGTRAQPFGPLPPPSPAPGEAPPEDGNVSGPAADATFDVKLGPGLEIQPKDQLAEPGKTVRLNIENVASGMVHNLYIGPAFDPSKPDNGAINKSKDLNAGEKDTMFLTLPEEPGFWEWWCNIPGHKEEGMFGSFSTGGTPTGGKGPLLPGFEAPLALLAALGVVLIVGRRLGK